MDIKRRNSSGAAMKPEKALEICNAINAAIVAGKTVTLDNSVVSIQVGGAIPGFSLSTDVHCILNLGIDRLDRIASGILDIPGYTAKIISTRGFIIRAYRPPETNVDIIYNPDVDNS